MVRNPKNPMPQRSKGGQIGGVNSGVSRRKAKATVKDADPPAAESSKGKKRMKIEDDLDSDVFDEAPPLTNYTNLAMGGDPGEVLEMPVTIQTSTTQVRIALTIEPFGTPIAKYLKDSLTKALKIGTFNQEMFETWLDDNQAKLSMNIGSAVVPSLLTLRNYLQPAPLNHQKMNKTAVRELLKNLHHKSLKLLEGYEETDSFPNQPDLTISLSTLPAGDRANPVIISQRQHQEQMTALYQQLAGTAEGIRRELSEWNAVIAYSLQEVGNEKSTVVALAQYLLENLEQLEPGSELPDLVYEVKPNEGEHEQDDTNGPYPTPGPGAADVTNDAEETQTNRRIPRVMVQQIVRELTDEPTHLCACVDCDPEGDAKFEQEVTKRLAGAYQAIENQIAERALEQGWAAGWSNAMRPMLDNAAAMGIPYPVPRKPEGLRYVSEPKGKETEGANEPKGE